MPDRFPRSPLSVFSEELPPLDHVPAYPPPRRARSELFFWLALTACCFLPTGFSVLLFLLWKGIL